MALSAGFGLDFERCSPEVFAAVLEELETQARRDKREILASQARQQFGGK